MGRSGSLFFSTLHMNIAGPLLCVCVLVLVGAHVCGA